MGFGDGQKEMIFMMRIKKMKVEDEKNIWKIEVEDGEREWVLKNIFGGKMKDRRIDIQMDGGRLNGKGMKKNIKEEEINEDLNVVEKRLDVVGEMNEVRDEDGKV